MAEEDEIVVWTDPSIFTVARIKQELDSYNVSYNGTASKSSLINVYRKEIQSRKDRLHELRAMREQASRTSPARRIPTPGRSAAAEVPDFIRKMSNQDLARSLRQISGHAVPVTPQTRASVEQRYTKVLADRAAKRAAKRAAEAKKAAVKKSEEEEEEDDEEEDEEEDEDEDEDEDEEEEPEDEVVYGDDAGATSPIFSDTEEKAAKRTMTVVPRAKQSLRADKVAPPTRNSNRWIVMSLLVLVIAIGVYLAFSQFETLQKLLPGGEQKRLPSE